MYVCISVYPFHVYVCTYSMYCCCWTEECFVLGEKQDKSDIFLTDVDEDVCRPKVLQLDIIMRECDIQDDQEETLSPDPDSVGRYNSHYSTV